MSPNKWIEGVDAIGIVSKAGRYSGIYAHSDIALEFASWISAEFKLYVMKDYQRIKKDENSRLSLNWNLNREISKINYHIHTDAVKENLILPDLTPEQISFKYASEADLLNVALFGKTAKQWREGNKGKKGNMRDYASLNQLLLAFDKCYNDFNEAEQKEFMRAFIDRIDIYQDKPTNGCWIKKIVFNFPVPINGKDIRELSLENETMLETVCLLSKLHEAKHHINVKVDMDELDLTSAEAKATYKEIEEWVQEHYGFHVTNLNIAKTKRKCGIIERQNYNLAKGEDSKSLETPKDKEEAIIEAFKHFQMI